MAILRDEAMSDVDRLLHEFAERYRAGEPVDPDELLSRVEGVERRELEALIDAFLARAARRPVDPEAFAGTRAAEVVDSLSRSLSGSSGLWPTVLPRLREQARLRRQEVVDRLAAALGVEGSEEKVARYYHQMEQGRLPAPGVSDRVLEALGSVVGQSAAALRRAGEGLEPGGPSTGEAAAFARVTSPAADYAGEGLPSPGVSTESSRASEWDEVDELFRGG
jgi:hypothetical protein